jgi:site-specific recombinase XerD
LKTPGFSRFAMNENSFQGARDGERTTGSQLHIICQDFACDLRSRGYATSTIALYVRIVAHFGGWLSKQQVRPRHIRSHHIGRFLQKHLPRCHCAPPAVCNFPVCRGALNCFLGFLRRARWIPDPPKRVPRFTATDRLLLAFEQHLDRVQGLSALTRRARGRYAREFLNARLGRQRLRIGSLEPGDCIRFVNARALALKRASLHALVVGLRSFLRFLEFTARIRPGLADAVPSPACPPPQPPLRVLDPSARHRFLCCFDRATPIGRRDYAIALCFTELALRANEVAALTLDDVDWRASTVRFRQTKQRRERLLPLPPRTARALAAYLQRGRPAAAHRAVFVSHWAPRGRPLSTDGVRNVIGRAFARCGIEATGPHMLRRSWATLAHQRGAGLKLIADILGHRSLETTALYAQVHFEELRQAALPWPCTRL